MNRYEIFNQTFSNFWFSNFLYKDSDEHLRQLWDELDAEHRKELIQSVAFNATDEDIIYFGDYAMPANDRIANAREVMEHYQYRLADGELRSMPALFRRVLMLAEDDDALDLLYLGTLTALSICLPGVHGSLFHEDILPNLYVFVTGAAASGKGKIGICRHLLDPINDSMEESKLIIPANSSDTAFYEELNKNGGVGIMFESEADTLTQAFSKSSGKFSEGLRCAFHNEPISYLRRTRNERVHILHPILSILLTGTPQQLSLLLKSPENGLFSRFLFYRLFSEKESFVETDSDERNVTGEMIRDYMLTLGEEIRRFRERLLKKGEIKFSLTSQQHDSFMQRFHDATIVYKNLFERAFGTQEAVDHADSIMKRMGNICYRMMMVMSVSRLIERGDNLPSEVVCDERDFSWVLWNSEYWMQHNFIHYDDLLVQTGKIPDLDESEFSIDPTSNDLLNDNQRLFLNALPTQFIKRDALKIGQSLGIKAFSGDKFLELFVELGLLKRIGRGSYEKKEENSSKKD